MPVTNFLVRCAALLVLYTTILFGGFSSNFAGTFLALVCGFVLTFPLLDVRSLIDMLFDRRPAPFESPTARAVDPRDGHDENPEDTLLGRIIDRRRLGGTLATKQRAR